MPALIKNADGSPHVHIYVRARRADRRKDPSRYICADPLCSHSAAAGSLYGKLTICAICHQTQFVLTPAHLKLARPACLNCAKTRIAKQYQKTRATLAGLLEGIE